MKKEENKMDLWKEIFCHLLQSQTMQIQFPQAPDLKELFELQCYQAILKIKHILDDETLDDEECFLKIEEIVCVFEKIGSNGGYRHDF